MDSMPESSQTPQPDWQEVLAFVQKQQSHDRGQIDLWIKWGSGYLAALMAITATLIYFFVGQSVDGAKKEVTLEVRARIDEEFKTDQIRTIIQEEAKKQTSEQAKVLFASEINKQVMDAVRQQEPLTRRVVAEMTGRKIDTESAAKFTAALKVQPSQMKVFLDIPDGRGSESERYATQFQKLFTEAGWREAEVRVNRHVRNNLSNTSPEVRVRDTNSPPLWAAPILRAVSSVFGAPAGYSTDPTLPSDQVIVVLPPF